MILMSNVKREVGFENARIGFRNFEGREGPYNRKGDRSFAIFLEYDVADKMYNDGWNVKYPKQRDDIDPEEDTRLPHIEVAVSFGNYPPNIYIISNGTPTRLNEDEIDMLDWAELETVDIVISPYHWEVNGSKGIKAYLKAGYFTIITDEFANKYGL